MVFTNTTRYRSGDFYRDFAEEISFVGSAHLCVCVAQLEAVRRLGEQANVPFFSYFVFFPVRSFCTYAFLFFLFFIFSYILFYFFNILCFLHSVFFLYGSILNLDFSFYFMFQIFV